MNTVFDLEKLRRLLRDFYAIAHVRITVFDAGLQEIVSYPEEVAPLCRIIRATEAGLAACSQCDRDGCAQALRTRSSVIYQCHAGLTEAVTPLFADSSLIGYLLIGHALAYETHAAGWAELDRRCRDLPLDREALRAACAASPLLRRDYIRSAAQIMHAVASYLVLERMAGLQEDQLAARLNELVAAHYADPVSASELCERLGIGRTQLYKLSGQLYGCGIAEHLRRLRLEKARRLLVSSEASIAEIAAECGFSDYNYFISVFSREAGCSPGAYRRQSRQAARRND